MELSEGEGLSQREVADRLGLSLSGAKSRLQRGRALLRGMLLDCCHLDLDRYGNVVDYEQRRRCDHCGDRPDVRGGTPPTRPAPPAGP